MAVVEKRKPAAVALLLNHLMFAIISLFIVLQMGEGGVMVAFGVFFLLLYLLGIYDYSNRVAVEQMKSYSTVKPGLKYPLIYSLIATAYFLVPVLVYQIFKLPAVILTLVVINAQFMFSSFIYDAVINYATVVLFCGLIFLFSFLGYLAGLKGFSLAAFLSKYLYVKPKKKNAKK